MDSLCQQLTTTFFLLLAKLPNELHRIIWTFTFLAQMQTAYATKDLEEMARRVCNYRQNTISMQCWLTTLLDLGVRIPNPAAHDDNAEIKIYEGRTAFQVAAKAGDIQLIRRLVRLGYDINAVDSTGHTAVTATATTIFTCQNLFVLQVLCEEGANVNFSRSGDAQILSTMLRRRQCGSPHISHNHLQAFQLLLKHGASLSGALHTVATTTKSFIKVLLDAGADLEELYDDQTPLATAISQKNLDMVQAFLNAGANIKGAGKKALFAAIEPYRHYYVYSPSTAAILTALCNAGADMTQLDHDHSILSYALTHCGNETDIYQTSGWETVPTVVKALCEAGSDVNLRHYHRSQWDSGVEDGDTPLHIASINGQCHPYSPHDIPSREPCEAVKILVFHGADINAQNDAGQTPLHLAVLRRNFSCVLALLQHGCKLDVKDIDGKTALMLAHVLDPAVEWKAHGIGAEIATLIDEQQKCKVMVEADLE